MKFRTIQLAIACCFLAFACTVPEEDNTSKYSNDPANPQMKMTTEIPEGIATPNTLNSSTLGELSFYDGVPYPERRTRDH